MLKKYKVNDKTIQAEVFTGTLEECRKYMDNQVNRIKLEILEGEKSEIISNKKTNSKKSAKQ